MIAQWCARCPECSAKVKGQVVQLLGGEWLFHGVCRSLSCPSKKRPLRIVAKDLDDLAAKHVWSE